MNEKQRIKKCINFEKTDKIPWQINYTMDIGNKITDYLQLEYQNFLTLGENIYRFNALDEFLGNHISFIRNRAIDSYKKVSDGLFKDEWGVIWDKSIDKDIGNPASTVLDDMNLKNLKVPDPNDFRRYLHFDPIINAAKNRYHLVKFGFSLFERAWTLRGMENLMIDFLKNKSFVKELFGIITDFNIAIIKNLANFPVDGLFFGDDWGCQKGLLMSPEIWREHIKPSLKKMFDIGHKQGYSIFIHSCGDISSILDDLIEIGLNVYNPFQPEVVNVSEMIKNYSNKLAFYGGIGLQKTLPFGTEKEIEEEVENRLNLGKKYGGLIIAPSHDLPSDIPLQNIFLMLEKLKSQ